MERATIILAAALVLLATPGCTGLVDTTRMSLREPGEQLRDLPDAVAEEYACAERELPHVEIESNELLPKRLQPGGELNHRLIYAMCPKSPTDVVRGRLLTRIRHRGEAFVIEEIDDYELKPGRWIIDAFVELPTDAVDGVYALEVVFLSKALSFEKSVTFAVQGS